MFLDRLRMPLFALALLATGGCLVAAGAGLDAGVYLSDRGAESLVSTPIDRAFAASQQVFREMGITEQRISAEQSGSSEQRQLNGKRGEKNVKVTLRTEGEGTRVEVVASEDMVVWDKELARDVLERIIRKTD